MFKNGKYYLECILCGSEITDFSQWFKFDQKCPECSSNRANVVYSANMQNLKKIIVGSPSLLYGLWHYFDFLPLFKKENIVTGGEGIVPIDRWIFLEEYAKNIFNINIFNMKRTILCYTRNPFICN